MRLERGAHVARKEKQRKRHSFVTAEAVVYSGRDINNADPQNLCGFTTRAVAAARRIKSHFKPPPNVFTLTRDYIVTYRYKSFPESPLFIIMTALLAH